MGTVSAYVMSSVSWSNQRAHYVIRENLLSKEFHCRTKDHKLDAIRRLLSLQSYFAESPKIFKQIFADLFMITSKGHQTNMPSYTEIQ